MCLGMRMADKYLCPRLFLWCLPCVNRWRKPKALWKSGVWWRIILTLLFPGGQRSRAGPAVLTTLRSEVHNGGPVPDWWVFPDPSVPWKHYSGNFEWTHFPSASRHLPIFAVLLSSNYMSRYFFPLQTCLTCLLLSNFKSRRWRSSFSALIRDYGVPLLVVENFYRIQQKLRADFMSPARPNPKVL